MNELQFRNELWKDIDFKLNADLPRYEVSNYGRVRSYAKDKERGQIIRGSNINGYKSMMVKLPNGRTVSNYVHRLVAETFLSKTESEQHFVIHMDYDKANNSIHNLKWVSEEQLIEHNNHNPAVLKRRVTGYKLTENDVKVIKKLLRSNKTRLSMIAKRFNITHTQLNRIRSGENWGHVTI